MAPAPCVLLVDNGSSRAAATRCLRKLAGALAVEIDTPVHPVSLFHSSGVDAAELDGEPAWIFEPFLHDRRGAGVDSFLVVPLFFGHSAAIFEYVPQRVAELRKAWPGLEVRIAPSLVDLHHPGEGVVADLLADQVRAAANSRGLRRPAAIVVDHGTPRRAVNRARSHIRSQVEVRLGAAFERVGEASMERRPGAEYDFNEPLLETLLGAEGFTGDVVLALLLMSPGGHAGRGGDIDAICQRAEEAHPGLNIHRADLLSEHPAMIELLATRYRQGLESTPVTGEVPPPAVP